MFRTLVLISILLGSWGVSAKSPDPSTVDFEASEVTCEEAQRIVNEQDETRIGYRGIFNIYQTVDVTPTNFCHYTQLSDDVFLNTKDGLTCFMGYGRFCRPDPRYGP